VIKSHAHWSLKRRLAIRLLAVLTFGVLGPSSVIVITAMWAINSMDDRALQDQAADIARNLDVSVDPPVLRLPEQLASSYRISNESYLYAVFGKDNGIVAASSDTASVLLAGAMHQGQDRFFAISQDGHRWPLYAYSTTKGPYKIAVAQGSLHRDALSDSIIRRLANFTVLTSLPLLAVTLLVAIWTLNRAFGAIERVASEATAITPGGAEAQLTADGLPSEIRPLVDAVNEALQRLGRAYEVEKRFTTDAAHELRTPIAVLTARIDSLPPGPLKSALQGDAARISRLVSQMLEVARLDAAPLPMDDNVDLTKVVRDAVAAFGPLTIQANRRMEMTAPAAPVLMRGNAHALALAVTNLVENAMLHTPAGSSIDIEVCYPPAIRVLDRGPGVKENERTLIFERFQRTRDATTRGTGLGLSIVSEIARRHGATASAERRERGGSIFTIKWS
jgi:signal transduction histidine kinase